MPRKLHEVGAADNDDRLSRTEERSARKAREEALARLAKELVELGDRHLERLGASESVLDAIHAARLIRSSIARNRQLRVVRSALRDANWPVLRARLDSLLKHGTLPAPGVATLAEGVEREWVVRLLGGGSRELEALLAEHPDADRRHLRELVRNAQQGATHRRQRAEDKLAGALRSLLIRR